MISSLFLDELSESGNGLIAPLVRQIHERALGLLRYRINEHMHDALTHDRNRLLQGDEQKLKFPRSMSAFASSRQADA
jgi:hypothetical protein